ncbi:class I SAM-dependent methyltransferase [Thalassotalea piscium]|uniref:Ubiquinone/menaquinone biosynthesis C-methylase UbiE n=1 Tax=Thalassotalea piscium TaxID=1230533 RepID=A0A7X0NFJ1_9GAMM|nr:class I SAM-dependent methyltransferase [Thalassotalea piscium]MBB6542517.1 ubiquinone/menaquinone biosynthesis C-methylase UbiE [Thalassotalea piscium]
MISEVNIANHYTHGNLLNAIKIALSKAGHTLDSVSAEQLTAIDEFHIGGREATTQLLNGITFAAEAQLLDIGCGLGGTTRYLASHYTSYVTGIDLTAEYIKVAQVLNQKLGIAERINLLQASATSLPFADDSFDGVTMLHVGMNVADKQALFADVFRCLRENSLFLIYDVMKTNKDTVNYPLPWASTSDTSYLSSLDSYQRKLKAVGFNVVAINSRKDFALDYFKRQSGKIATNGVKPLLSLHTLIQDNAKLKFSHLIDQISSNALTPIEIIVKKPG